MSHLPPWLAWTLMAIAVAIMTIVVLTVIP